MSQVLLKCKIGQGMFSDESVAEIRLLDGRIISYFVPSDAVVSGENVKVEVFKREGVSWVTLPTAHPHNAIPVRNEDLIGGERVPA